MSDGAFLPDPQTHASGAGSGKKSIRGEQNKTVPGIFQLWSRQAGWCVSGCYGDKVHCVSGASALARPQAPLLKPRAGLEVLMEGGYLWARRGFRGGSRFDGLMTGTAGSACDFKRGYEGEVLLGWMLMWVWGMVK